MLLAFINFIVDIILLLVDAECTGSSPRPLRLYVRRWRDSFDPHTNGSDQPHQHKIKQR